MSASRQKQQKIELDLIPTISINPSSITVYKQVNWIPVKRSRQKQLFDNDDKQEIGSSFLRSKRKSEGKVSIQAKRKMGRAIEYLVSTSTEKKVFERLSNKMVKFKISFITLTLPSKQIHKDSEIINKCLNSFLLECKKFYHVKNYVWRAEKQKNGNIHFHLLTDKFIPYNELRNRWNRIVNKLGYVDRYQERMKEFYKSGFKPTNNKNDKRPETQQYMSYKKAASSNFSNPNSTDIHSTRKIKDLKKYVCKYMTKETIDKKENQQETDEIKKQSGRLWSCNHELSQAKGLKLEIDWEISDELEKVFSNCSYKKYEGNYFSVYQIDYHVLYMYSPDVLFRKFANYLFELFGYSDQLFAL